MNAVERDRIYREVLYPSVCSTVPVCVRLDDLITPAEQVELRLGILLMPMFLRGEFPCPTR